MLNQLDSPQIKGIYYNPNILLQVAVGKEREKYQAQAVSALGGVSAIPKVSLKDKMTLNQTDASYLLSLECQTAVDNVLLHSDVPVSCDWRRLVT